MSRIIATGSYLPEQVVTNNQLIESYGLDSSTEWIEQRTGIKVRRFANEDETVSDMGIKAAQDLLSKVDNEIRNKIKLILVATMSQTQTTPSTANRVQAELGCHEAMAFDINAACSGFVYAMDIAVKLSLSYKDGYTLVIGAEKMSQILDLSDRSTAILFGDGAGAVLLENDGKTLPAYDSQLHSQPDPTLSIAVEPTSSGKPVLSMNGREVFNFVQRTVVKSLETFVKRQNDIDYIICHQANYRFIEMISKRLKKTLDQVPSNIQDVGNTSAASIPILLDSLVLAGKLKLDGSQSIVMTGFGGGLSWGEIHTKL